MALYLLENRWWINFTAASRERTIGLLKYRAIGVSSAAKQLFRSREAAANCVGPSLGRIAAGVEFCLLLGQPKINVRGTSPICKRTLAAMLRAGAGWLLFALLALSLSGCRQVDAVSSERPRDQVLPAFMPTQLPPFTCSTSSAPSKPVDLEAKTWFDEATALLKARARVDIDGKRVTMLEQKAAARGYWPAVKVKLWAMHGEEKIVLIERAMSAGEPEAFYMMGELYMKGDGVEANEARANAFLQRAAMMGDVRAMVKLAVVLSTKQNNTIGWDMANIPVATSMLECAMKKGHGDAAIPLRHIVLLLKNPDGTFSEDLNDTAEARGLAVLQEGVKLGSREAASELASYFLMHHQFKAQASSNPRSHQSVDALRARYYRFLQHSLDEETPERLPNLDAAVPLPPTALPDWRNEEDNIVGLWETAAAASGETKVRTDRLKTPRP